MWPLGRVHTVVAGYGRRMRAGTDEWVVVLDRRSVWIGRTRVAGPAGPVAREHGLVYRLLAPGDVAETVGVAVAPNHRAGPVLGFMFVHGPIEQLSVSSSLTGVLAPNWFVLLLSAVLPARWLALRLGRWRREELVARGLCAGCGYDLRATPDRCPECGLAAGVM
jgi:hypothetical protein